jgi:ATP-dependent 26S proteasome regulatory subunit
MSFLLDGLRPEFVIIDDLDKADLSKVVPTILDLLQKFKVDYPDTSVILSANNTENFDPGLLRPGRIDTWYEFTLPDADERREILTRYLRTPEHPGNVNSYKVSIRPGRSNPGSKFSVLLALRMTEVSG